MLTVNKPTTTLHLRTCWGMQKMATSWETRVVRHLHSLETSPASLLLNIHDWKNQKKPFGVFAASFRDLGLREVVGEKKISQMVV